MQNGLGDKAAALSFSGHAVQNSQCFIWKDDIDAFAHTILGFKNLAYTFCVYVQWLSCTKRTSRM